MNDIQLKNIQKVQLSIMDEIHKLCVKHNLKYYLIGGSALGAVRHSGFIPWDVDIDIAMPRKDYELFINKISKKLPNTLKCIDYRSNKLHYSPHALVALLNSKLHFKSSLLDTGLTYGSYGIYIDILPLDSVPNNKFMRNIHDNLLKLVNILCIIKRGIISSTDSKLKIRLRKFLKFITPISVYHCNLLQQKIAQLFNSSALVERDICSTLSHYKYEKLCMPKEFFGNPIEMKFEDRNYYVPHRVNDYLSKLFGDYMKLPSLEHQNQQKQLIVYAEWTDKDGIHKEFNN